MIGTLTCVGAPKVIFNEPAKALLKKLRISSLVPDYKKNVNNVEEIANGEDEEENLEVSDEDQSEEEVESPELDEIAEEEEEMDEDPLIEELVTEEENVIPSLEMEGGDQEEIMSIVSETDSESEENEEPIAVDALKAKQNTDSKAQQMDLCVLLNCKTKDLPKLRKTLYPTLANVRRSGEIPNRNCARTTSSKTEIFFSKIRNSDEIAKHGLGSLLEQAILI